ncbi:ribonuclease H-like domain-containing protein [Tanacetum coccineum]|uniref:Ribonuclease H-like domain-containing protein n=1 Tax=Tanacetum coccineum TaxID=301880 RepID=A0ABQ4ZBN8_9ASTR
MLWSTPIHILGFRVVCGVASVVSAGGSSDNSVLISSLDLSNPLHLLLIRNSLLSRETLPDVKDAFAIVSREESHRGIAFTSSSSVSKTQVSGFMSKTNFSNSRNNGTGRESGGLYLFDEPSNQSLGIHCDVTAYVSKTPWHRRFGHPADQVYGVLQKELQVSKQSHVSPCDICHMAKQTRDPIPFSDHKTSAIGDLIYRDFWGPYKVLSREGFSTSLL